MKIVPKPDLRKLVDAINELTQLAVYTLEPITGTNYNAEKALRQIVATAIERGINLQRDVVIVDHDEIDTPLLPPSSDVPEHLPPPPKLPKGVGSDPPAKK